ncbi:putative 2og-fe oxygenase family protein [Rosellinia necatrix]|uniref:Putative 2og-fe oxygenase family protein n=1 Tax=Rosellinia necatrix TaxID=77044 RepID=A0A1W2TGF4_ROSNE|nr:putative 2og-fe oxygenase family protein [Rosellinia necatrix]
MSAIHVNAADPAGGSSKVAPISLISYDKLLKKDAAEAARLFTACADWGFFYLDLAGANSNGYIENIDRLFDGSKAYFAQTTEEKMQDTRKEIDVYNICGFKPMGPQGLDSGNMQQKKNGSENLRVPANLIHLPDQPSKLYFPVGMNPYKAEFTSFITDSSGMARLILENLSDVLKLEGDQRFESFHPIGESSTSSAVVQHYPTADLPPETSAGHFTHTDTGSITVLYNTEWGLQVFSPVTSEWEYVPPRPGCAIINVGDTLKFLSGLRLRSSLHRVAPPAGSWGSGSRSRYACIYFLRAADNARFVDMDGVEWTGAQWLSQKFGSYRKPHEEQEKTTISTGRVGFAGLWEPESNLPSETVVS